MLMFAIGSGRFNPSGSMDFVHGPFDELRAWQDERQLLFINVARDAGCLDEKTRRLP